MASSDVDQKFLGRLAKITAPSNALLSSSLYQLLGLSVLLAKRLLRARKLRKLDTTRDTKSLQLYHHILWLSREGLSIVESHVLPYTFEGQCGPECRVLSVKLRASFYHIFCLFHNNPPVSAASIPTPNTSVPALPLSPRADNGQTRRGGNGNGRGSPKTARKTPTLRDPILSITSDATFVTNPYAAGGGAFTTPTPTPALPPGLPVQPPHPASFILPALNFIPITNSSFNTASTIATILPGSHPLRLSVALEHSAFVWDVLHDHAEARRIARNAIREVYRAQEGLGEEEFEDAAELVGVLGRMMKRGSKEGTPRPGGVASPLSTSGSASGGRSGPERATSTGTVRRSQAEKKRKQSSGSERGATSGSSPSSAEPSRHGSGRRRELASGSSTTPRGGQTTTETTTPLSAPRRDQRTTSGRPGHSNQVIHPQIGQRHQGGSSSRTPGGSQGTTRSGGGRSNSGSKEPTPRSQGTKRSSGSNKERTPQAAPDRRGGGSTGSVTQRGAQQSTPTTRSPGSHRTSRR